MNDDQILTGTIKSISVEKKLMIIETGKTNKLVKFDNIQNEPNNTETISEVEKTSNAGNVDNLTEISGGCMDDTSSINTSRTVSIDI